MKNSAINIYGNKYWHDENGEYHREDAPAVEYSDGYYDWCWHGKFHRDNGKDSNAFNTYFFNDENIT